MQIITESNLLLRSPSSDCRFIVAATPIQLVSTHSHEIHHMQRVTTTRPYLCVRRPDPSYPKPQSSPHHLSLIPKAQLSVEDVAESRSKPFLDGKKEITLDDGLGWEFVVDGVPLFYSISPSLVPLANKLWFCDDNRTPIEHLVRLVGQMTFVFEVWSWFFDRYVQSR
jgi:hypothetical protein